MFIIYSFALFEPQLMRSTLIIIAVEALSEGVDYVLPLSLLTVYVTGTT